MITFSIVVPAFGSVSRKSLRSLLIPRFASARLFRMKIIEAGFNPGTTSGRRHRYCMPPCVTTRMNLHTYVHINKKETLAKISTYMQ